MFYKFITPGNKPQAPKGVQKTFHSRAFGSLHHGASLLGIGKLPFVQDGQGCAGLLLSGEEDGRVVPLDPGGGRLCKAKGSRRRKGHFLGAGWERGPLLSFPPFWD